MSDATGIVAPAATTVRKHFYIGGGWSEPSGGERLDVVSPSSEEIVGSVPLAIPGDIDRAVSAARRAFDAGPWPHLELEERVSILEQARARLAQRGGEIAHLVTLEMGLPISVSRRILGLALFYVDDAVTAGRAVLRPEVRRDISGAGLVLREPVGVVGAIVPWNGPFLMAMAKAMPALVAGCTVVLKPAAESPLDAYVLAEVFEEVGLPPGVLNIVPGDGVVGEHLVRHPAVDMVSFTGSTTVGTRIGSVCGERLRRVCLELGGKSAAIVLDDADLSSSAPFLGAGIFFGSGQACVALSRVLAPRRRYDEVVDALCEQARIQVVGDPFDPATTMGPLVSQRQRDRVEGYIADGRSAGARAVVGGGRPAHLSRGWYVEATVFADVANDMRIAQDEIFGPVVVVIPYGTLDEAVAIANDSGYGLGGAVFTADAVAGLAVARRVRTGTFAINAYGHTASVPFGGVKGSGVGREHGPEGLSEYLEYKSVTIPESLVHQFE